jgi:hypothetical protein
MRVLYGLARKDQIQTENAEIWQDQNPNEAVMVQHSTHQRRQIEIRKMSSGKELKEIKKSLVHQETRILSR